MSILQKPFSRRHEPPRHQAWDSFQDHGLIATRASTTFMAFQGEPYPPMVNAHIEWKDTPETHVYKAHLRRMNRNYVKVEVDESRVLCIIGEKRVKKQEQRGGVHHVELSSGHFVQRLTLPENSMIDHVKARMDNEVLTVKVSKHRVMNNNHRVRNINISEH